MSSSPSPTPPKGSVRNIISIFENQTIIVDNEPVNLLRRAKSLGSLSQKPTVSRRAVPVERIQREAEPANNLDLDQIEQQVRHLQSDLRNNYRTYSRENHIHYQNQIIVVLTDLGTVETNNNPRAIDHKSELTEDLQRLNKKLNALLPSGENSAVPKHYKSGRKSKPNISDDDVGRNDKYGLKSKSWKLTREVKKAKAGLRSTSLEEKQEVKINRKEPVERETEERVEVVQKVEDDVDSAAVSVRNLKELFEKNTNEQEGKTEFGMTKISRKFMTFNSTSDLKYVPYSQKFKSGLDSEFRGLESADKRNSYDLNETVETEETTFSYQQEEPGFDDEEKSGDMSPDSFDGSGQNSSSEDSDSEQTAKESLDDE